MAEDFIEVPLLFDHDFNRPPIGKVAIRKDMVPLLKNHVLAAGYRDDHAGGIEELLEMSITPEPPGFS